MKKLLFIILIFSCVFIFDACDFSDNFRQEGEIFHAAPTSSSIGETYFGLYDDGTYEICNNGGIGQDCYEGKFALNKDTLTLLKLDKEIPYKSNRFLIIRYAEQDSSFWQWKHPHAKENWKHERDFDMDNGSGNVYQLDSLNHIIADDDYFIIRLDSLKNYHQN